MGKVFVHVLSCKSCGSRISAGGRNVRATDEFDWCPACLPGCYWRYGRVVEESDKARELVAERMRGLDNAVPREF